MSDISATRQRVYDLVYSIAAVPVWRWLPASIDELPCYVVGRPDVDEGAAKAMHTITTPVYALGRTLRDDDAQAELDALADALDALLWKPPQEPGSSLRLTRMRATVVTIANVEIPAYTATVVAATAPCQTI